MLFGFKSILAGLIVSAALFGCSYDPGYIGQESDTVPVALHITNSTTDQSVRCVVSMAHYITFDLNVVRPDESLDIDLLRGVSSSTLYFKKSSTRLMAVENVICGTHANWSETKRHVELSVLRSTAETELTVHCTYLAEALTCQIKNDTTDN